MLVAVAVACTPDVPSVAGRGATDRSSPVVTSTPTAADDADDESTAPTGPAATTGAPAAPTARPPEDRATVLGTFDPALGAEISGIAAGRAVDGLWLVDDPPGTRDVHLVGDDGGHRGTVRLTGVRTVNPEDLAVGPCPDDAATSCVHVADIGDNVAAREDVVVLSVPEGVLDGVTDGAVVEVEPTVTRLRWADGPRDAEALAVLPDGSVLVVDKSQDVAVVAVARPGEDVLSTVARWTLPPPPPLGLASLVGHTVTAADVAPDGRTLVVRTYDQLLLLTPPGGQQVTADTVPTLPDWDVVDLGRVDAELQGEAVTLLPDDRVVTVAEGSTTITATSPG